LGYCFYFIVVVSRKQTSRQETTGKTEATMELDEFLCERNLERYRRLANSSTHACERQVVLELLAEEVAKLKSVPQGHTNTGTKLDFGQFAPRAGERIWRGK
jgi:hypothetical protein